MLSARCDVYTWIPLPEVVNPIHALPGGPSAWGPGACGPFFGGDNFKIPPTGPAFPGTFRAMQTYSFQVAKFGDAPIVGLNTGCVPGITTVLTAKRSAGGVTCHSVKATVKASSASVKYDKSDGWYRVQMHGSAQDPVPAGVGGKVLGGVAIGGVGLGGVGKALGSAGTPVLEWELDLRIQDKPGLPRLTTLRYATSSKLNMDVAATTFSGSLFGTGVGGLIHGLITLRRFPSLVVYVTLDVGSGPKTVPLYFADASGRSLAAIAVGQTDVLRQMAW